MPETDPKPVRRVRFLLALVPFLGLCVAVPFVNRVTPYVLGMPFFLFWIALWSVLTSACMAVVYLLDPRNER